jgi:predicted HAD superfamily Cof-like phosphohydrolase
MIQTYKALEQVNLFMKIMGQEMPDAPCIPSKAIQALRYGLIDEENNELSDAAVKGDIVEVADALCDLLYVVNGAFTAYGFKPELVQELFDEVQRSNMSKLCQDKQEAELTAFNYHEQTPQVICHIKEVEEFWTVVRTSDNKILKSYKWQEPDLKSILERHGLI